MTSNYDHKTIEPKWQAIWSKQKAFATPPISNEAAKNYVLCMFPYPSGAGLHVGHVESYSGTDVLARTARKQGQQVLYPMGWDAFGLPAENYAIKSGVHPAISTAQNIENFRRQINSLGLSYDWEKEVNTSSPEYYKWTQWIFSFLYKQGLAYRKDGLVNWCPKCQTVLANEQVVGGRCERCGTLVAQKQMKQWYFRITNYAERLLNDLDTLDWPEKIKSMQRNWIGKSTGAKLWFSIDGSDKKIEVFTTRVDTLAGATFLVVAPEHPLVDAITTPEHKAAVEAYKEKAAASTELERTFTDREKTGVFIGSYVINPLTGIKLPIWIADYVLGSYGTGAVMAVPAHDERDFGFAQKFSLPITQVIESNGAALPYFAKGVLLAPSQFAGMTSEEAIPGILEAAGGQATTIYRLRDWLVSRQRYWGAPIPVLYDEAGNEHLVEDDKLPVELPLDVEFRPTGQSPLQLAESWRTVEIGGKTYTREADTLDTFVCSSWYYLRYPTPHLETAAFDKEAVQAWLPVDMYIGGAEHAVLHLLYARFFTKVFFDAGLINFDEPFTRLRNQGMILGPDGQKMSKSLGNVINPDDVVAEFGADALRLFELFLAPFEMEKPWNQQGLMGIKRFLEKVWRLQELVQDTEPSQEEQQILHKTIAKVTEDTALCRFNTAISAMMEAVNGLSALPVISRQGYANLLIILNSYAPHITEELWETIREKGLCSLALWPSYDPVYLVETEATYAIQINGKLRATLEQPTGASQEAVLTAVKALPRVQEYMNGKEILKEIFVQDKLVSLVLKS